MNSNHIRPLALGLLSIMWLDGAALATHPATEQLQQIQDEIQAKVEHGARTESEFVELIDRMDSLLIRYWDERNDAVAEVLYAKAELYAGPLQEPGQAIALLQGLKFAFPATEPAGRADAKIASLQKQGVEDPAPSVGIPREQRAEPRAISRSVPTGLAKGQRFPDFSESDLDGQPLSVSMYQGKVVLIDFWATWCRPCVGELPNVLQTYRDHHDDGFEVIGVSLDQDRGKLASFIRQQGVPWPQYFDGRGWSNKLAGRYGIRGIPATFLLDRDGVIIATNLRGRALDRAVAAAVSR